MNIDKKYYIHSRGGVLGSNPLSSVQDVDAIVAQLGEKPAHLVMHFHGGLISAAAGFKIAENLLPLYLAGGHPIFYIWESGAWDAIRNNITELADEPVFKQLVRKLLEYALKQLGASHGVRSLTPSQIDPLKVKQTVDRFVDDPRVETIPYRGFVPVVSDAEARSAADSVSIDEIVADLELDGDFRLALSSLPDIPAGQRSALAPAVAPLAERHSVFAETLRDRLSEQENARGIISFFKAALLVKNILIGILRRYEAGRDHGLYATVVEEIVRSLKVGGSGLNEWGQALQWNRMKKDCDDAFVADGARAGTALLGRIRDALDGGHGLSRITLIGHSTGAIYICAWLEAADKLFDADVQFDVVFLAPAVTYARFASTLQKCSGRIRSFRMFAMSDELERNDQVWGDDPALGAARDWRRFIYPSSLLYLVSGILESKISADGNSTDEPDMPLVGMQRYFNDENVYSAAAFPEVDYVRNWLKMHANTMIWSYSDDVGDGLNSHSSDHGAFDNDASTLASLRHILTSGF